MKKRFCLLLILIFTALSLVAIQPADAAIPKPSVPEFTLEFVDEFFDVPTTYEIDPYTGENVTHPGFQVPFIVLEVKIKNQTFVPYYDADSDQNITIRFDIRMKEHHSKDWGDVYRPLFGHPQIGSEYTVIQLGTLRENGFPIVKAGKITYVPSGSQVDFQVEAMIGYFPQSAADIAIPGSGWPFFDEKSGWSNTQTITIPDSSIPTPSPTPTSFSPDFSLMLVTIAVSVAVVCIVTLVYFKRRKGEVKPS